MLTHKTVIALNVNPNITFPLTDIPPLSIESIDKDVYFLRISNTYTARLTRADLDSLSLYLNMDPKLESLARLIKGRFDSRIDEVKELINAVQ